MKKVKRFLRISYLLLLTRINNFIYKKPTVKSDLETIDKIIYERVSVSRFGDGEISIIRGGQLGFQKTDNILSKRLNEVLMSQQEEMIICIPDIYTYRAVKKLTFDSKIFWLNELLHNKKIWYSMPKDRVYYDACITRPYIRIKDKKHSALLFDKLKKVWESRDVVIIEGKYSRLGVGNDLFDKCKSVSRLLCPPTNAFDKYDEILEACMKLDKELLLLLSVGPTATILAYDLNKRGYQAFDLGHIDVEYEWFLQNAETRVRIKNKAVNELNVNEGLEEVTDERYHKQIIAVIE